MFHISRFTFYTERLKECPPLLTSPAKGEESRIPLPRREGRREGGQTLVRLVYVLRFTFYASLCWLSGFPVIAQLQFTEVTSQAGIHFQHKDGRSGEKYYLETLGSGAAWFDYDRDGDLDIYFVNGTDLPGIRSEIPPTNALYRNNGDPRPEGRGYFTDVTSAAGVGDGSYGFGCCVGDYDNDGYLDLYVTNFGPNILYHNNGDGTFTDVTAQAGVGDERWGSSAAFIDYENDGDLDLFVANYVDFKFDYNPLTPFDKGDNPVCHLAGERVYPPPADYGSTSNLLYRNNGDGTFTDITKEAGLFNPNGKSLSVVCGDYNNDGYLDIFVTNDVIPNMLYRNNGDALALKDMALFTDVALFAGVAFGEMGVAYGTMGACFGDYDNDGWLDLVTTTYENDPCCLYHNDRDGRTFGDTTYPSGYGEATYTRVSWGGDFVDLDNDGYQDIFVANGHIYDNAEKVTYNRTTYAQQNQIFRNMGNGVFKEISDQCGEGLLLKKVSRGAAFGDYDNDGDIDILITNSNQTPDLLRNDSVNQNHWLVFSTVGVKSNRDGIGARVKVIAGGISQIREVKSGGSYLCQNDMRLHFGLGEAKKADLVEIRWPGGLVERFENVNANQFLMAKEGEGLSEIKQ
jgi:hypothetical protein